MESELDLIHTLDQLRQSVEALNTDINNLREHVTGLSNLMDVDQREFIIDLRDSIYDLINELRAGRGVPPLESDAEGET